MPQTMDKEKKASASKTDMIEAVRTELRREILEYKKQGDASINRLAQDFNKKILALQEKVAAQEERLVAQEAQISAQERDMEALDAIIQKHANEIEALRAAQPTVEDGEIPESLTGELNTLREQVKALQEKEEKSTHEATTWAQVIQKTQKQVEDAGNWIEVAKKQRIPPSTPHIINDTLEEEKRRKTRASHVRVVGWKEGVSPKEDATSLCTKMGIPDTPFVDAWRVGKDTTRERALILKFRDVEAKQTFLTKRRALKGEKTYLEDDLTLAQVAHRRECMPRILEARKAGKWAVYRDGRVIITDRRSP